MVATLLATSLLAVAILDLMPGSAADLLVGGEREATPEEIARLRELLREDQSIFRRYGLWLAALAHGELGYSRVSHQPVATVLWPALAATLQLSLPALVACLALGLVLGAVAAARPRARLSRAIVLGARTGISVPGFWLGLLLIQLFAVRLGVLPPGGLPGSSERHAAAAHFVLPLATLVIVGAGPMIEHTRAAMQRALAEDYIRTARAKGLSDMRIAFRHALRNASLPIVTLAGLQLGEVASGIVLVETIFAWPGMGMLLFQSIQYGDYLVALAAMTLITALVLSGRLIADCAARWLDPRLARSDRGRP